MEQTSYTMCIIDVLGGEECHVSTSHHSHTYCSLHIKVGLSVLSVNNVLNCHWLVAEIDCALVGHFLHMNSLLELGATCRSSIVSSKLV